MDPGEVQQREEEEEERERDATQKAESPRKQQAWNVDRTSLLGSEKSDRLGERSIQPCCEGQDSGSPKLRRGNQPSRTESTVIRSSRRWKSSLTTFNDKERRRIPPKAVLQKFCVPPEGQRGSRDGAGQEKEPGRSSTAKKEEEEEKEREAAKKAEGRRKQQAWNVDRTAKLGSNLAEHVRVSGGLFNQGSTSPRARRKTSRRCTCI